MTIQLDWPPEIVDRVTREAQLRGLTVDAYLLQSALRETVSASTSAELEHQERKKAADDIRTLRKGNVLGPDLTLRDLIEEGRRF
jgi:hypothetical protein